MPRIVSLPLICPPLRNVKIEKRSDSNTISGKCAASKYAGLLSNVASDCDFIRVLAVCIRAATRAVFACTNKAPRNSPKLPFFLNMPKIETANVTELAGPNLISSGNCSLASSVRAAGFAAWAEPAAIASQTTASNSRPHINKHGTTFIRHHPRSQRRKCRAGRRR